MAKEACQLICTFDRVCGPQENVMYIYEGAAPFLRTKTEWSASRINVLAEDQEGDIHAPVLYVQVSIGLASRAKVLPDSGPASRTDPDGGDRS